MNRAQKWLAFGTTVMMFIMLLMGAWVTNTGSGDGCGAHYPLCKGTFMPDWDYKAIVEFSHRGVSGLGGFMTLVLAIWIWRTHKQRPLVRWLAVSALGFVILQGALGATAVLWPQPKTILALHFGFSLICFATVLLVWTLLSRPEREAAVVAPQFKRWVWFVTLFAYGTVYLGAFVRHMKAAPACVGFPLCNGQLIPPLYGLTFVNFIHRLAAAMLLIMIVRLALMARQWAGERRDIRLAANVALGLVILQVGSGALFGLGYINLMTQMLHTALVSLLWGSLNYLVLQVTPVAGARSRSTGAPASAAL